MGVLVNSAIIQNKDHKPKSTYNYRLLDFGLMAGIGYHLTERTMANIRYSHSIIPITDHPNQANQYNSVLMLSLHYRLNKKDNL